MDETYLLFLLELFLCQIDTHACCDCLTRVTNCKSCKLWNIFLLLNDQWLYWLDFDNCGIAILDEVWLFLQYFARCWVELLDNLSHLTGNLCCVNMEHWCVSNRYHTWVIENDNLSSKFTCNRWDTIHMSHDIATCNILL